MVHLLETSSAADIYGMKGRGLGFGVCCLGFRFKGLEFRVDGSGFMV